MFIDIKQIFYTYTNPLIIVKYILNVQFNLLKKLNIIFNNIILTIQQICWQIILIILIYSN